MRKRGLQSLLFPFLSIVFLLGWVSCRSGGTAGPPNVVLIFADDLGYGDLGSYGHPTIRTPNLDRMAAEGIRLTSFYSAASSCTPARAGLLTGRYPQRMGLGRVLGPGSGNGLAPREITIARALKERGYRTAAIGKWHLGHAREEFLPTSHGFEEYFGLLYSNDMMPPWVSTDRPLSLYRGKEAVEHPVDQTTLTLRYTQEAVRFIRAHAREPFFLYLADNMPHVPIYTAERFQGRSLAGRYGDVIETIDWSVGEILKTLREEGLEERTLVIFTSDNGPWLNMPDRMYQDNVIPPHELIKPWHAGSPGPLRGAKGTSYEGGFRVPCIIRWPGRIPAGQVSAEVATALDLFVTILDAAGVEPPSDRPIDGNNLLPFLEGREPSPTEEFLYFQGDRAEAVRAGPWKFRLEAGGEPELYHLNLDPTESYNRAGEEPDVVKRLEGRLDDWEDGGKDDSQFGF